MDICKCDPFLGLKVPTNDTISKWPFHTFLNLASAILRDAYVTLPTHVTIHPDLILCCSMYFSIDGFRSCPGKSLMICDLTLVEEPVREPGQFFNTFYF